MWFNLLTLCASKKGKSREEGGMSSLCFGVTIYVCVLQSTCACQWQKVRHVMSG